MTFSLSQFDIHEMLRCGMDLRKAARAEDTMEAAARAVVGHLRQCAVDPATGREECILVRFYKTHPYGSLPPELQAFARAGLGGRAPRDDLRCLVLLATAGDEADWNDPRRSRGHRAIPLDGVAMVEEAPMIAQLVRAMGLDVRDVVAPRPEVVRGVEGKAYRVFYVPEALGSPYIPAQDDFVRPHRVRSVIGFGGTLSSGDLYAVIVFARVHVPPESADRFRNVALDLKVAFSEIALDRVFAGGGAGGAATTASVQEG